MHIYIANTTKQQHDFTCRLPERITPYRQLIGVGKQIKFPAIESGLPKKVMDGIIEHHARYGMVHVSKVNQADGFVGLVWSESPIDVKNMVSLYEHNIVVLEEQGQQAREDAAVQTALDVMQKSGASPSELNLTIDVKEVTPPEGMRGRDPNSRMEGAVQVTADPAKLQEAANKGHTIIEPRTPRSRKRQ